MLRKKIDFSLVSAILVFVYVALYICNFVFNNFDSTIMRIIPIIILLGTGISCIIKKEKVLLAFIGAEIILDLYYVIINFSLYNILSLMGYVALGVIIVLKISNSLLCKKIWFIPAILKTVNVMIELISNAQFIFDYILYPRLTLLLVNIAIMLFMGLWLKDTSPSCNNSVTIASNRERAECYGPSGHTNIIGGADKLKAYKELLDSGVITQEEFESKKKDILDN